MNKYSISDADTCPKPDISVFSPESTEFCFSRDMTVLTMNRSPDHYCHAHSHSHPNYEFCLPLTPIPFMTVGEQIYFGEVGWVIPAPDGCAHGLMYDLSDISLQILTVRSEFFITYNARKRFFG